jgi:hypothetical protein
MQREDVRCLEKRIEGVHEVEIQRIGKPLVRMRIQCDDFSS